MLSSDFLIFDSLVTILRWILYIVHLVDVIAFEDIPASDKKPVFLRFVNIDVISLRSVKLSVPIVIVIIIVTLAICIFTDTVLFTKVIW